MNVEKDNADKPPSDIYDVSSEMEEEKSPSLLTTSQSITTETTTETTTTTIQETNGNENCNNSNQSNGGRRDDGGATAESSSVSPEEDIVAEVERGDNRDLDQTQADDNGALIEGSVKVVVVAEEISTDRIQQEQHQQLGNSNITGNSISSDTHLKNSLPPREPQQQQHQRCCSPIRLPIFKDPRSLMWTSTHAANAPSEDRSASLVNILLQPLPDANFDNETQIHDNLNDREYHSLIRLNLWSVIDGHGGGCVATYASEVLLPHLAASISRALKCTIVSRGVCLVNGQLRNANAMDLDGLIKSTGSDVSYHYRSPYENANTSTTDDTDNDKADDDVHNNHHVSKVGEVKQKHPKQQQYLNQQHEEIPSHESVPSLASTASQYVSPLQQQQQQQQSDDANIVVIDTPPSHLLSSCGGEEEGRIRTRVGASSSIGPSISSAKPSVKTAASFGAPGTHSPEEITAITRAITQSFLSVDEGWINSIDPVATHQTSCQSNGTWNSGACVLVSSTVQRLEWTKISSSERGDGGCGLKGDTAVDDEGDGGHDTFQNKDAARRRMLDHNVIRKSVSSLSTISSKSSLTTTYDRIHNNASGLESEITETEGEEDDRDGGAKTKQFRRHNNPHHFDRNISTDILVSAPGGCSCHCYRAYDAMLYTAHVGDCRAVMLGTESVTAIDAAAADEATDATDDESSHHSSDETECLSSSDHDAGSSGNDLPHASHILVNRHPRRQSPRRRYDDLEMNQPFISLPPLEGFRSIEIEIDPDHDNRKHRHHRSQNSNNSSNNNNNINSSGNGGDDGDKNNEDHSAALLSSSPSSPSQDNSKFSPTITLPLDTRPVDLTTDHSAYNPAEVIAVFRRCNNYPRAISASLSGGIKRVAGSLAVTRALGDAYLKTPHLSFSPYKHHVPFISARPEVNCRPLVKGSDKVLVLATDGVWELASGEDVLRWARTFYAERLAEVERRKNHHRNVINATVDAAVSTVMTRKRDAPKAPIGKGIAGKFRKLTSRSTSQRATPFGSRRDSTVADVIVRRVLNKVRRARNISSLHALMSLPPGRARRSKHDDITACVVDLSSFVS